MKYVFWAILVVFGLIEGCTSQTNNTINLITEDGMTLAASYYPAGPTAVILLHMMDKNRHSYDSLAAKLNKAGFSVLSIDLRGHGESSGKWKDFSPDDFKKMMLDVKAARQYLIQQKVAVNGIVGASIGANLALRFAAEEPSVKYVVLLSPGLEYHGIKTEDVVAKYNGAILFVASKEDSYSAESVQKLYASSISKDKELKLYNTLGHGTDIFVNDPAAEQFVLSWISPR